MLRTQGFKVAGFGPCPNLLLRRMFSPAYEWSAYRRPVRVRETVMGGSALVKLQAVVVVAVAAAAAVVVAAAAVIRFPKVRSCQHLALSSSKERGTAQGESSASAPEHLSAQAFRRFHKMKSNLQSNEPS